VVVVDVEFGLGRAADFTACSYRLGVLLRRNAVAVDASANRYVKAVIAPLHIGAPELSVWPALCQRNLLAAALAFRLLWTFSAVATKPLTASM
jgi:hypothetical protein